MSLNSKSSNKNHHKSSNKKRKRYSAPPGYTREQYRKDTMQAYGVLTGIGVFLVAILVYFVFIRKPASGETPSADAAQTVTVEHSADTETETDQSSAEPPAAVSSSGDSSLSTSSAADSSVSSAAESKSEKKTAEAAGHKLEVKDGITYVDGIMIVNKTYSLPADYAPGLDPQAEEAFNKMASDAWADGVSLFICSGFRSYREQEMLYNNYAAQRGADEADRVSSRAGHSEHQSGLCMDVNTTEFDFAGTHEAIWLANNCADYGFIIRFPLGKEKITGYAYEPWHIRYVGVKAAKEIFDQDICLEEYLGVTSDYKNSTDQNG